MAIILVNCMNRLLCIHESGNRVSYNFQQNLFTPYVCFKSVNITLKIKYSYLRILEIDANPWNHYNFWYFYAWSWF